MSGLKTSSTLLGDFRTDARLLVLIGLALPVGVISALVAKALLWLIAEITNVVFFQQFSPVLGSLQHNHLGMWVIAAPVAGAIIIGLMARYGSEKIRGHGIPEALEAILLGRSLIEPKVALLKPISSAISIGTGGPFGAEGPIIMTGGAFGSILAQLFHLSAAERKTLLVAGAAGRNVGRIRIADCRHDARGRASPFRVAPAQFHPRSGGNARRMVTSNSIDRGGSDISGGHPCAVGLECDPHRMRNRYRDWICFRFADRACLFV